MSYINCEYLNYQLGEDIRSGLPTQIWEIPGLGTNVLMAMAGLDELVSNQKKVVTRVRNTLTREQVLTV